MPACVWQDPLLRDCPRVHESINFMWFGPPQVLKTSECDKEMAARHSGFGQFEVPFLKSRAGLKVRWAIACRPRPLMPAVATMSFSGKCVCKWPTASECLVTSSCSCSARSLSCLMALCLPLRLNCLACREKGSVPHVPQADWEVPCVQGMGSLRNASGRMQLSCTQRRRPNMSSMHAAAYSLQGSLFWLETVVVL